MRGIVAEDGKLVTDEMIARWEESLERDEWPSGWENVGEVVDGGLPAPLSESVTLSVKVPAAMKAAVQRNADAAGKTTSAYVRGVLASELLAS